MKSTTLRLPDTLHDSLAAEAADLGISLNALIRLRLAGARFDDQSATQIDGKKTPSTQTAATQPGQPQQPPTPTPRLLFTRTERGTIVEARPQVQALLEQLLELEATRDEMLDALVQDQTDPEVIMHAGYAVDNFLREHSTQPSDNPFA